MTTRTALIGFGVGVGVLIAQLALAQDGHVRDLSGRTAPVKAAAVKTVAPKAPLEPMLYSWLTHANGSPVLNLLVENKGAAQSVLVDVELYDQNGAKVYQEYKDDVALPKNGTAALQIYPPAEAAGTYHFGAGIFQAHWGPMERWFYDMPTVVMP